MNYDIKNGIKVLPQEERKKILLLSDDLRFFSGVATMSRAFIMGTAHHFNWVQLGASLKKNDNGRILDISEDVNKNIGISDSYVRIIPWEGYGNAELLRELINIEQPDAILHFTDPRYWEWLYKIEHEIRQNIPILYYTIWDNVGSPDNDFSMDPLYNRNYYESCDGLLCISKQTYGMVNRLLSKTDRPTWKPYEDWQIKYVPHGINSNNFKPVTVPDDFRKSILGNKKYEFILFWNNRNMRRKQPSDVIYAYKLFCDKIGKDVAKNTCLLMHTRPVDKNGTDLYEVADRIAPFGDVRFSTDKLDEHKLNYIYNLSDCTINIANNEGFGLTTAESIMAGTPIIVNVTGGLQDQCGFTRDECHLTANDYIDIGTLHDIKHSYSIDWGEWVNPVWSVVRNITGEPTTPYIWEDRVDSEDVVDAILNVFYMDKNERKLRGKAGRNAFMHKLGLDEENMCKTMTEGIHNVIENWTPKKRYELYKL